MRAPSFTMLLARTSKAKTRRHRQEVDEEQRLETDGVTAWSVWTRRRTIPWQDVSSVRKNLEPGQ